MSELQWRTTTRGERSTATRGERSTTGVAALAPVWQGVKKLPAATASLDKRLGGTISRLVAGGGFDAARGAVETIPMPDGGRVVVAGLGPVADASAESIRGAAGRVAAAARSARLRRIVVDLDALRPPRMRGSEWDAETAAAAVAEGVDLALYRFDECRGDPDDAGTGPARATLRVDAANGAAARRGLAAGRAVAAGAMLARTLVNRPANRATPALIAAEARALAKRHDTVKVRVLGPAAAGKLGMGSFLSVAAGSVEPPQFIVVTYEPAGRSRGTVALVGKTVTFDSGGLSLKPGKAMETMKGDMGGGAAVLGAIDALAALGAPVRVVAVLAAAENMPSGSATRPGDIVEAMNGVTIEILNTDAEGRLTLADALAWSARVKPDAIIDIATLTGACMVAVGPHRAGLFTEDENLRDLLMTAGDETWERLWPLPLDREYDELVKSKVADVKNTGGTREGGATIAAVFLRRFAPEGVPWAHLDIAGKEFTSDARPYAPVGATGFGARLLTRFVLDWAESRK